MIKRYQSLGGIGDSRAPNIYRLDLLRKITEKETPTGQTLPITKCKKTQIDLSGFEYGTLI